jgi:hypothetical protein
MRKYYQFNYSGRWEGYQRFYKKARLLKFLQNVPAENLSDTTVTYWDGKFHRVGAYFLIKSGAVRIKF